MKNLSAATIAALAIWLAAPVERCLAGSLNVDTPSSIALGNAFTVNVGVSGITDLYAFQFDLGFDPSILAVDSSAEGPFLPGGGATFFIPGAIDNVGGTVAATADTLLTAIAGVTGDGTLASFTFESIGEGTSGLTLSNVLLLDSGLNAIDVGLNGGSITVGGASAVPEPSTTLLMMLLTAMSAAMIVRRRRPQA